LFVDQAFDLLFQELKLERFHGLFPVLPSPFISVASSQIFGLNSSGEKGSAAYVVSINVGDGICISFLLAERRSNPQALPSKSAQI